MKVSANFISIQFIEYRTSFAFPIFMNSKYRSNFCSSRFTRNLLRNILDNLFNLYFRRILMLCNWCFIEKLPQIFVRPTLHCYNNLRSVFENTRLLQLLIFSHIWVFNTNSKRNEYKRCANFWSVALLKFILFRTIFYLWIGNECCEVYKL